MDFLNPVLEEIITFLGISHLLEALKTGNYEALATFDGIMTCIFIMLPFLPFIQFCINFFREKQQLKPYKVNFPIIVFNRSIGGVLAIGMMIW